jgi:hypothetical protein
MIENLLRVSLKAGNYHRTSEDYPKQFNSWLTDKSFTQISQNLSLALSYEERELEFLSLAPLSGSERGWGRGLPEFCQSIRFNRYRLVMYYH